MVVNEFGGCLCRGQRLSSFQGIVSPEVRNLLDSSYVARSGRSAPKPCLRTQRRVSRRGSAQCFQSGQGRTAFPDAERLWGCSGILIYIAFLCGARNAAVLRLQELLSHARLPPFLAKLLHGVVTFRNQRSPHLDQFVQNRRVSCLLISFLSIALSSSNHRNDHKQAAHACIVVHVFSHEALLQCLASNLSMACSNA